MAATVAVWIFVVVLHWHNDGLWYQGDSPMHALNGVFWMDFLKKLPGNPQEFALSYYARYPAINPISYPPVFYLLEAAAFAVFGDSPFIAKGLVLGFTLLGSLYLLAWLRRYVAEEAGWAAALLLLQPAIIIWSHAVMLNLPSMALGLAGLYHCRRWLEEPGPGRHLYWAAAFALLATLTYMTTAVVVLLMVCWVVSDGKLSLLLTRRTLAVAALCGVLLVPWFAIWLKWDSGHRQVGLVQGAYPAWKLVSWAYYLKELPHMVTLPILLLAAVSPVVFFLSRRWRKEMIFVYVWFVICYGWYSLFSVKETRYALLLVPPALLLAAVTLVAAIQGLFKTQPGRSSALTMGALAALLLIHIGVARRVYVPEVTGVREIALAVQQMAPNEWVFYDGYYPLLFTFYVRAQDPGIQRGVVRSSKLLYATKIDAAFGLTELVASAAEVVNSIRTECGCRYLVVEKQQALESQAQLYLRQALTDGDFR
ncbi:glycosyltransferase family 39 protein, partial [Bradyrhizobium sp.]|uniref:glycosyltransferase family 39 protein n=1 Tax=Bradyrhizobium sp. TaxID=376 RepID=UPI003C70B212